MEVAAQADAAALFFEFRAAKEFADKLAHQRHAGLPAHQDHLIKVVRLQLCVGQRAQAMESRACNDVASEALEFSARQPVAEAKIRGQERQRHFHGRFSRKFDLGLLSRFADSGEHGQILGGIRAACRFDFLDQEIEHAFVEVVPAQARVAVGGEHLENSRGQFENGQIKGASSQIIDCDF